jgi:anti-sigma B factor antagonist
LKFTDSSTGLEFWVSVADGPEGTAIVTVFGELDGATAPQAREALTEAMDRGGDVEVDLRGCGFVDSRGIAAIVWAAMRLAERQHKLFVVGARPRVRGILELAGVAGHSAIVLDEPLDAV